LVAKKTPAVGDIVPDNVELIHQEQYIVLALTANNMRILVTGGIGYASSRWDHASKINWTEQV
jgi:molybdopterin biosynthesis enzyme MoaB